MALLQNYAKPVMYMSEFETKRVEYPEIYYAKYIDEYIPYQVDRVYEYGTPIEHGGLGQNTIQDSCFTNAEDAKAARENYRKMLHQCMEYSVDINLMNHPEHIVLYDMVPKDRNDYSPFVDDQSWLNLLKCMEADLDKLEENTIYK